MRSICSIDGCGKEIVGQGLCRNHYAKDRAKGVLKGKLCSVDGCQRTTAALGMCYVHYRRAKKGTDLHASIREVSPGRTCNMPGCDFPHLAKGLCSSHYGRLRKGYETTSPIKKRSKTLRTKNIHGYVMVWEPEHPNANKLGYVLEHRMLMAKAIGRPLFQQENVHHKNGDRSDNRLKPEHALYCPDGCCNLELWSVSQPSGQRVIDKLEWARQIIDAYGSHYCAK